MLIAGAEGVCREDGTLLAPEPGLLWLAWRAPYLYGISGRVSVWRDDGTRVATWAFDGVEGCHIAVGADAVFVAGYGSGTVHRYEFDGTATSAQLSGSGPDAERQEAAHPHHVLVEGDTVLVTDLGSDALITLDAVTLAERGRVGLPPGSGPRYSLRLDARTIAVTGELDATVMRVRDGVARAVRVPDLRSGAEPPESSRRHPRDSAPVEAGDEVAVARIRDPVRAYPSDLVLHRGELVVAVRGSGLLARFDPATLELLGTEPSGGPWPQALAVENGLLYCANRDTDTVTVSDGRVIRIHRPTALIRTGTP
ncbi:beta-propeller fold lactonase family protein [Microbacteriaceae bacterium VKM Ac-2855]|nr:beta-propeller fold lactonase family protein [Microbacteriaceae bacterium VKM Ac-2855]